MKNCRFLAIFAISFGAILASNQAFADIRIANEVENRKVHFESADYKLSTDAKLILDQAISLLARMNEPYSLKVMGFTDSHGNDDLNQNLSVQRANIVANYFVSKGIERERILIQGRGWEQPVDSNETEEGRSRNRRVEFKFITPDTTASNLQLVASADPSAIPVKAKEEEVLQIGPQEAQPVAEELKTDPTPPAPVAQPTPVKKEEPKLEEEEIPAPMVSNSRRGNDTMLASEKKRSKNDYYRDHVYENRKRGDQGQTYVQISPIWARLNGASTLGAASNKINSQMSFRGEAGWVSFLEDDLRTFVVAKAYGHFMRFDSNATSLTAKSQKQFPFAGELGIGHYFHPSFFLQLQSGYGKELDYHLDAAGNIEMDTDWIWHAGMSTEIIAWRFSKEGDIGLDAYFNYYDLAKGILESGSSFGMNLFVDYEFLRAGFGFSKINLDTTSGRSFDNWQFGPNFRVYF